MTASLPTGDGIVLVTNTLDVGDIMADWLVHHRTMGFAGVIAIDLGSVDGTAEELASSQWAGFVDLLPTRSVTEDTNHLMLERARERSDVRWALMIDTDEFVMTPSARAADLVSPEFTQGADAVVVPRFHMTTVRSAALADDVEPRPSDLTLRWCEQDQGKAMIDLRSGARTDLAGHGGVDGTVATPSGLDVCLLHYPVRSYRQFAVKVDRAANTLVEMGDMVDDGYAWHWRRWVGIRDEGGLPGEYLEQFLDDGELTQALDTGEYAWDRRLSDRWLEFGLA